MSAPQAESEGDGVQWGGQGGAPMLGPDAGGDPDDSQFPRGPPPRRAPGASPTDSPLHPSPPTSTAQRSHQEAQTVAFQICLPSARVTI